MDQTEKEVCTNDRQRAREGERAEENGVIEWLDVRRLEDEILAKHQVLNLSSMYLPVPEKIRLEKVI